MANLAKPGIRVCSWRNLTGNSTAEYTEIKNHEIHEIKNHETHEIKNHETHEIKNHETHEIKNHELNSDDFFACVENGFRVYVNAFALVAVS